MKKVYVLRHGEKDKTGNLTERGKRMATELGAMLPQFTVIISSNSPRTIETAIALTGIKPVTDGRAGYYDTTEEVSAGIGKLAAERSITFLEAAQLYNGGELVQGIQAQAVALQALVNETLANLPDNEKALVVSHDMTMTPALILQGCRPPSLPYLSGYIVRDDGTLSLFDAEEFMNPAG